MALRRFTLLTMFVWGFSSAAAAQAIDCASTALNNSAHAVCASAPLRALAASMDRRYLRVDDSIGVKQGQLQWSRMRDRCNGNLACLSTTYRERLAYLAKLPATAGPATVGEASRPPVKHLFLRHAPAQLLIPAGAQPEAAPDLAAAGDQRDRAAGPAPVDVHTPHRDPIWLLGGVLLASIVLWQLLTNVCGKCPSCHQWFARLEIDQRHLTNDPPQVATRRRRVFRQLASAGHLAHAEPVRNRSATVRHYHQCRMCLHEWETTSHETK